MTQSFGKFYDNYWTLRLFKLKPKDEGGKREEVTQRITEIKNTPVPLDEVKSIVREEYARLNEQGKASYSKALSTWIEIKKAMAVDLREISRLVFRLSADDIPSFANFYASYWNDDKLNKLTSYYQAIAKGFGAELDKFNPSIEMLDHDELTEWIYQSILYGYDGLPNDMDKIEYLKNILNWFKSQREKKSKS